MKDRSMPADKRRGAANSFDPAISKGKPELYALSHAEYIGVRKQTRELKHLSNRRNRNQPRFP